MCVCVCVCVCARLFFAPAVPELYADVSDTRARVYLHLCMTFLYIYRVIRSL